MATKLDLQIALDSKGAVTSVKALNKEINVLDKGTKNAHKSGSACFNEFAKGAIKLLGAAYAIRAIKNGLVDSTRAAIDAEETHSKFGVVFSAVADKAAASAKDLADNWGLSKNAAEAMMSSTGDLLAGLGMGAGVALDLSVKTQQLAIDLASFTNYAGGAKGASEALTKAMLGERESIKQLGIVITEEMVKDRLLLEGKDKLTGMALQQAKAEAVLAIAISQSKNAIGDYERTQDSTTNSIKRITAAWDDVKIAIGSSIVETIGPLLMQFRDWFIENKETVIEFARESIEYLKRFASFLYEVGKIIYEVIKIVKEIIDWTKEAIRRASELLTHQGMIHGEFRKRLEEQNRALEEQNKIYTTADLILKENNKTLQKGISIIEESKKATESESEAEDDLIGRLEQLRKQREEQEAAQKKAAEAQKKAAEMTEKLGSSTEGLTRYGRDLALQLMTLAGYLPEFTDETHKAAEEQEALAERIRDLIYSETELTAVGEGVYIGMLQWAGLLPSIDNATEENAETTKKWTIDWRDANEVLRFVQSMVAGLTDLLGALGVELGETGKQALNAAAGIGELVTGIISKNPLQVIAGVTKALTGLVNLFKGDGVGEAINRENRWMELTKQQIEQLRTLTDETGSVHEATSIMLDDIINQTDITIENFGEYAGRIREILSELDRGEMTLAQTQTEIGDSFTALISKAEELGTTGSNSLMTLFDDLAGRGIQVAEITEYINQQMTAGLDGYRKYLEGDFSDATIGVFEGMLAYEKKVAANQSLIDGVQGITEALVGMSNATRLTEEEFDNFELAARDAFDALRDKGFTEKESLAEMAPMLSRMIFLHNEYGLAIDAETQALIDKAKAEGVNLDKYKSQEEIFSDMDTSLRELVDIFKNAFPSAISETTKAFRGLNSEAGRFNPDTNYKPGPNDKADIHAASGFYSPALTQDTVIQAHRGESVLITPKSERGDGGGRTTKIEISVYGNENPASIADKVLQAYRSNTRGLRSTLEGRA